MIKTRAASVYCLICCLFFILPSIGFSDQPLVAVTEIWPPFRINSPEAEDGITGVDIDILKGLEKHLKQKIVVHRHPFARALAMIRAGEADLISGVAFTSKRSEFISYVPTAYFLVTPVFYTQKDRGHLVRNYDDLYRFKIGYSLHSAYFEPFNSDARLQKIGVSTEEQLIKMVALGRIDIIIGTNPNLAWDIKKHGFKDKIEQIHYIPPKATPIYMGLAKKDNLVVLQGKIDDYLKKMVSSGELEQISKKYQ